jgi:hypothetical protein
MFKHTIHKLSAACAAVLAAGFVAALPANAEAHHRHHRHHSHHSSIPQHNGGDRDADNNGGPSDGDGNV